MANLKNQGVDFLAHMHKKLGNGADTSFWEDIWLGDMSFNHRFPRLYALELDKKISVATKVAQSGLITSFRRAPRSGLESSQLADLVDKVGKIYLVDKNDRWYWDLEGSSDFSVASFKKLIDRIRLAEVSSQTRWIKEVPIKVNVHAWKVKLDALPSRLNISRRGMDVNTILCPICNCVVESSSHIFFACYVARDTFRKICRWWNVDFSEVCSYEDWLHWMVNTRIPAKHKTVLEGVCYGLWWHIWSFRNKCVFGSEIPPKDKLFEDVVLHSFSWMG